MSELSDIKIKAKETKKKLINIEGSYSYRLGYILLSLFKKNNKFNSISELFRLRRESKFDLKAKKYKLKHNEEIFAFTPVHMKSHLLADIDLIQNFKFDFFITINNKEDKEVKNRTLLAKIIFFDRDNKVLEDLAIKELSFSEKNGFYKYIHITSNTVVNNLKFMSFQAPVSAHTCSVQISPWEGKALKIRNSIDVKSYKLKDAPELLLLKTSEDEQKELPLPKGTEYKVSFILKEKKKHEIILSTFGEFKDKTKALIAVFKFYDDSDNEVLATEIAGLNKSEKVGFYKYIQVEEDKRLAIFKAPAGSTKCTILIKPWAEFNIRILNKVTMNTHSIWDIDGFELPESKINKDGLLIASICDTFTEYSLKYDLNLVPVLRTGWKEQLNQNKFDLLLVESAWDGNNGDWKYALTNPEGKAYKELKKVIAAFKAKKIKTIFYNKEDSPNYDTFIHVAKLFDIVATSDINCIEQYKKDCNHNNVFVMPFAAQPKIHNPIGKVEPVGNDIAFAGTWYKNKHQERTVEMPMLLDPASKFKLSIFNRQSHWTADDSYDFPAKYKPFLHDKVAYEEMLSIHKMFKVILNTNSVNDSNSMFSRRVFEVLASSTPIVSTVSPGVRKLFPNIVPVVTNHEEAATEIELLLKDDTLRKKIGHLGYREVMNHHTVKKRFNDLFLSIGIGGEKEVIAKVCLAIPTNRIENLKYIRENVERQNYKNLEAIVILNNDKFVLSEVEKYFKDLKFVKIIQIPEKESLGICLNESIKLCTAKYWFKMDDDDKYYKNYVSDTLLAFKYTDAKIVGKRSYHVHLEANDELVLRFPGNEHKYSEFVAGATMAIDCTIFDTIKFEDRSEGEDSTFMKVCRAEGYKIYSADSFNYVTVRKEDKSEHTWSITDQEIQNSSSQVSKTMDSTFVEI